MKGANTVPTAAERVMVALDYPGAAQALELVDRLTGIPCYFKVGMELYYAAGPAIIRELKARGHRVFADLKLHDIPNTVRGAARSLARLQVDMFNVHCAGGAAMLKAARAGVDEALAELATGSLVKHEKETGERGAVVGAEARSDYPVRRPLLIGVTQLTSTSRDTMNREIGIPGEVEDMVVRYARMAKAAGLDGVVASPREVPAVKRVCGADFLAVTPGIRPAGADLQDQARVMTPAQALEQGSDYLVIGRPVTASPEPRRALETILKELTRS